MVAEEFDQVPAKTVAAGHWPNDISVCCVLVTLARCPATWSRLVRVSFAWNCAPVTPPITPWGRSLPMVLVFDIKTCVFRIVYLHAFPLEGSPATSPCAVTHRQTPFSSRMYTTATGCSVCVRAVGTILYVQSDYPRKRTITRNHLMIPPVPCVRPLRHAVSLWPIVDEAELHQRPQQAPVLTLLRQIRELHRRTDPTGPVKATSTVSSHCCTYAPRHTQPHEPVPSAENAERRSRV